MGFFSKIFKPKSLLPIIGAIFGSAVPGVGTALGASLGGAAGGALGGGGLKGALVGAGTAFAGNAIGNSIAPSITSSLAKAGASNTVTNSLANSTLGRLASNTIGPAAGSSLIGDALGKYAGNSIANSVGESLFPEEPKAPEGPAPFSPQRENQLDFPGSLTGLSGLDENQVSTNLATQGVYGGGVGPEEENYFLNMVNRRLVDDSGAEDQDLSEINPIENSFLSQIGLGGYADPRSLLEAISKRKQGAYAA